LFVAQPTPFVCDDSRPNQTPSTSEEANPFHQQLLRGLSSFYRCHFEVIGRVLIDAKVSICVLP